MGTNQNGEDEIDLAVLFLEILAHWKRVLLSIVLVAAAAFVISETLITPMYTSTSELYVLSSSTSITSLADIQIGSNLTTDYQEIVTGRPVLDQVIENLNLECTHTELLGEITISNPSDSRILKITVEDADPTEAKRIADEVAEVSAQFIADKMNQDPPNIIQYGYVATNPSSPDIKKNTVIGGLLGAVLSILIIVVSYLLNDTILSPDEVESKLGLNVLASVPKTESEYDGGVQKKEKKKKTAGSTASAKPKKKAANK